MDRLEQYRVTIQMVLHEHAQLSRQIRAERPNDPDIPAEAIAVCDPKTDNYLLVTAGWTAQERIHSILMHLRMINGQIHIEWGGIEGLMEELIERGIPESMFVMAMPTAMMEAEVAA